jgi:hypothetical protein
VPGAPVPLPAAGTAVGVEPGITAFAVTSGGERIAKPRHLVVAMVGVLAKFEFLPGHEQEIDRFFAEGRTIVEGQPATTGWYAARLGPTTYAAFAVFAT